MMISEVQGRVGGLIKCGTPNDTQDQVWFQVSHRVSGSVWAPLGRRLADLIMPAGVWLQIGDQVNHAT